MVEFHALWKEAKMWEKGGFVTLKLPNLKL